MSHHTVRSYLELLVADLHDSPAAALPAQPGQAAREVPPSLPGDSGILHRLLDIETDDDLLGHPVRGASWEGWVVENILAEMPDWRGHFYRTARGAEIDLVLEKGRKRIAVECKASTSPEPTAGFWHALSDLEIADAWIVCLVKEKLPGAQRGYRRHAERLPARPSLNRFGSVSSLIASQRPIPGISRRGT